MAPPRGTRWNASTINGNNARGHGMLLNELYAGRIVWNKVRMVKDPATGKRISRINAKDQHRITEAPQLRIIDDAAWNAAQAIKLNPRPQDYDSYFSHVHGASPFAIVTYIILFLLQKLALGTT